MKSTRSLLRDGDPARDAAMSGTDIARIRASILSERPRPAVGLRAIVPVAVALVCAAAGSAWLVRSTPPPAATQVKSPRQRQLQFSTPGGTRVIWFFNPDLEVR